MPRLFELRNVNLSRNGTKILNGINWAANDFESWAILGGNGAGKSSLLKLVLGELRPDQNFTLTPPASEISWFFSGKKENSPIAVKKAAAYVSPELHNWYFEHGWILTGEELILSGLYASPLLYCEPATEEIAEAHALAKELELEHLLEYKVAEMSQGQLRNMLVARALMARPLLLGLDEVFEGLDEIARENLFTLLEHLAGCECAILMTAHRPEDLPSFIKKGVFLKHGEIQFEGILQNLESAPKARPHLPELLAPPVDFSSPPLLELKEINVFVERTHVLHNINWTVEKGQNWAVLGENGSGKTTLLRCLWGEEHHALGGRLAWFGNAGPHDMPKLRKSIGLVSDRLQAAIPPELLAEDLVVSGFYGSLDLYENPNETQKEAALGLMEEMHLAALIGRQAGTLSYGQLRRILLCRALVHSPFLLMLDEPCSGLDNESRFSFLNALAEISHNKNTQIMHITHRTDDLAGITTHALYLNRGHVTYSGVYPRPI